MLAFSTKSKKACRYVLFWCSVCQSEQFILFVSSPSPDHTLTIHKLINLYICSLWMLFDTPGLYFILNICISQQVLILQYSIPLKIFLILFTLFFKKKSLKWLWCNCWKKRKFQFKPCPKDQDAAHSERVLWKRSLCSNIWLKRRWNRITLSPAEIHIHTKQTLCAEFHPTRRNAKVCACTFFKRCPENAGRAEAFN